MEGIEQHGLQPAAWDYGHDLYIVSWTKGGRSLAFSTSRCGYGGADYTAFRERSKAFRQAKDWWEDADQDSDQVDVLRIDLATLSIEILPTTTKKEQGFLD